MELTELTNEQLLDLYELYVRVDHYDPFETPKRIEALRESGVSLDDLRDMVLDRLQNPRCQCQTPEKDNE